MLSDLLKEKVIHPISTVELERRWRLVRKVMKEKGVDFLLAQNDNDYLGGYVKWFTDLPGSQGYPVSVIFPRGEEMTTISHGSSDPAKAGPPPWLLRGVKKRIAMPIMLSLNFTTTWDAEKVVEEIGPGRKCCISFVNEGDVTAGFSRYIRERLTNARFVDITDEIDEIKAVKSPEEIECIRKSAYIHDEAMKACLEAIEPGVREYEVAAKGFFRCRMLGSENGFILIGSAPAGQPFPYNPTHAMNRVLRKGDQIGILVEVNDPAGYYTHLHRVISIGKPTNEMLKLFDMAKEAQQITLRMLKPGADPAEMLAANNEYLQSRGYPPETRLYAHGQGYDLVERPSFQPGETMKVTAGMNIAVHPSVVGKGTGLLCDNYMVTETGVSECLHQTPKEILVV